MDSRLHPFIDRNVRCFYVVSKERDERFGREIGRVSSPYLFLHSKVEVLTGPLKWIDSNNNITKFLEAGEQGRLKISDRLIGFINSEELLYYLSSVGEPDLDKIIAALL